jgi:hypothetical protein
MKIKKPDINNTSRKGFSLSKTKNDMGIWFNCEGLE